MPTPDASLHVTPPRSHPSCPPEPDALESQDTDSNTISLDTGDQEVIDAHSSDESQISVKIRLDGPEDDGRRATEVVASRNTTVEADRGQYPMLKDLGFALTAEGASKFTDLSVLRRQPLCPPSFLRPGSRFSGSQTDKKAYTKVYSVEVEIKQVDMRQSTICGYLKIDGLTDDFPSLTTFFDGEIIGPHFSFITKHSDWGASEKIDMAHWERFSAFRPLAKQARNPDFYPQNTSQRENIFMRWKERFVVPDHKVSEIPGASYEGFYYLCFNQVHGTITGVYFHAKSDRYQSLDLKHVASRGCLPAMEWA